MISAPNLAPAIRHPHNFVDMAGVRFGRLVVNGLAGKRTADGLLVWRCKCDCGKAVDVIGKQLRRGQTQSCGCLLLDRSREANTKHGQKGTRLYRIWGGMLNRIRNPRCKDYFRYGGRGIAVCKRWESSFENFLADMGQPPTSTHSIDRINNDGNYEPGNCRWATPKEQIANRRRNTPKPGGNK